MKLHFTEAHFDLSKKAKLPRVKVSGLTPQNFEKRSDKAWFEKLARHVEPMELLLANFIENPNAYIVDIVNEGQRVHSTWRDRTKNLSKTFVTELKILPKSLKKTVEIQEDKIPVLLTEYIGGNISMETLLIVLQTFDVFKVWDEQLNDVVWAELSFRLQRYGHFLRYDREKFKQIALAHFTD